MPFNPACAAASPYCSDRPRITKGYCDKHYYRVSRYGHPEGGRTPEGATLAFLEAAVASDTNECIVWPYACGGPGAKNGMGYPTIWIDGRGEKATREVLRRTVGDPPDESMDACHDPVHCSTPRCINPRHLRWDTRKANVADQLIAGTANRGETASGARLPREQIRAIFVDRREHAEIAVEYGIHKVYVSRIKRRLARADDTADLTPVAGKRSGDEHWRRKKAKAEAEKPDEGTG